MRVVANMWYYRSMTLIGKVTIINSLMASLYVYKMQVLPVLEKKLIKEEENVIKEFLWQGKREKIPMCILMLDKAEGGLNLVNLKVKHKALLYN